MARSPLVLVVALVAAATLAACGGNGNGNGEAADEGVTAETGIDPGAGSQNFNVALNPPNGAGRRGSATVTAEGGEQVRITIQLDRAGRNEFPAEIREGTCAELSDQTGHELSDVEVGVSETLLEVSIAELRGAPQSIVVLQPDGAPDMYEACGELGDATGG